MEAEQTAEDGDMRYYSNWQHDNICDVQARRLAFVRLLYGLPAPLDDDKLLSGALLMDKDACKIRVKSINSAFVYEQQQDEILISPTAYFTDVHVGKGTRN
jgi:hypothetical protein